jgi:hypothetical protein
MKARAQTKNRGQVSSEYLVIMAVVLVIALVVVFLLRDFIVTGSSISESQSRSYWSVASPFSISAQKYAGTALDLDLQNTLSESVTLTSIEIEGTVYTIDEVFRLGEQKVVSVTLATSCGEVGDPYSLEEVEISYQRGSNVQTQGSEVPLVGTCS